MSRAKSSRLNTKTKHQSFTLTHLSYPDGKKKGNKKTTQMSGFMPFRPEKQNENSFY